jgi:delta-aminolevulinic acid dehydratase/porphobilinogen synthase
MIKAASERGWLTARPKTMMAVNVHQGRASLISTYFAKRSRHTF